MKTPTGKLTPEDLYKLAFEVEQQAARIQALVRALAIAAGQATDEELCLEALQRLLAPLCEWASMLSAELYTPPTFDKSEVQP